MFEDCEYLVALYFPDFYEEMLALLDLFTTISVSPHMWQLLPIIYETFSRDGFDYFSGVHNVCVYGVCLHSVWVGL